jgi:hypothetical protein
MSTSKRHFTAVIGKKEHGLYCSSNPSSAAKKIVSKLCASDKKKKVSFFVRETTQGSKKKVYGPYIGEMKKLEKPIELKDRLIKYESVAHLDKADGKKMVKAKAPIMKKIKKMSGGGQRYIVIALPRYAAGFIDDLRKIHKDSYEIFQIDKKIELQAIRNRFTKEIIYENSGGPVELTCVCFKITDKFDLDLLRGYTYEIIELEDEANHANENSEETRYPISNFIFTKSNKKSKSHLRENIPLSSKSQCVHNE